MGASDEAICARLRTDFAVMYACGLREYQALREQASFVLPETPEPDRRVLMDEQLCGQAAPLLDQVVVDTFPCEQGSQRVTDGYKAQKKR